MDTTAGAVDTTAASGPREAPESSPALTAAHRSGHRAHRIRVRDVRGAVPDGP